MYNPLVIEKNKKRPTALIAGGAGFLGLGLTESLLSQNFRVVIVDNLSTSRREKLEPFLSHPRFTFFDHDLNLGIPDKIESVDFIFHLAAHEAYLFAKESSISLDSLLTNALTTFHLLELTKATEARFLFASSLDIYQGLASFSSLDTYFGQEKEERLFSHAEAKRFGESLVWEYYKKYDLDVRVVRLGELYGPGMDLRSAGNLGRLIKELLDGRELTVEGDGLDKEYYCFIKDAVSGAEKALIEGKTKGRIYPLCGLQPVTVLEQAYIIKKLAARNLKVVFRPLLRQYKLPEIKVIDGHSQKEIGWSPKVTLKEGLKETLESLGALGKKTEEEVLERAEETVPVKAVSPLLERFKPPAAFLRINLPMMSLLGAKPLVRVATILALIIILLALNPLTVAAINGYLGWQALGRVEKNLWELKIAQAGNESQKAASHLLRAKKAINYLPFKMTSLESLLTVSFLSAKGFSNLTQGSSLLLEPLAGLGFRITTPLAEDNYPESTKEKLLFLNQAEENFSLAEGEVKSLKAQSLPKLFRPQVEKAKESLPQLAKAVKDIKVLAEALPNLLGFSEPKTYLILLQNSNELRPTGGFIGSYARFDLDKGKLLNLKIDDIYNPDGLLDEKGVSYPAPKPIKENLSTENLRLRDANWSPDFPSSAKTIAQLYYDAVGERVSGVAALDLTAVSRLLAVSEPISLPTFNETVTAENLFEKVEFRSEAGFFPGSSGKKTFLSALGESLLERLLNLEKDKYQNLSRALFDSLESKDILLSLDDPKAEALLAEKNWSGKVKSGEGDYLMVVEANVGATKANYFVRRQLNHKIERTNRQGEMEALLSLNYVHAGESNAWPGGPYKCYLRLYVPKGSALLKVLRSAEGLEGRGEDITEKVKIGEELGKTTFEILFELKAGESLALAFSYVLPPEVLNFPESASYRLLVQKQPGTGNDPLTIEFTPPFGKEVSSPPLGAEKLGQIVRWKGNLSKDVELEIPF